MAKKGMQRSMRGNHPNGIDWVCLSKVEADGETWFIYLRPAAEGSDWESIKIVAGARIRGRANYWLGWNGQRFSRVADLPDLMARRELFDKVMAVLQGDKAADWMEFL